MMRRHKKIKLAILLGLTLALHTSPVALALPQGGVIAGGSGSISTAGNAMDIAQQTKNMFVNWDAFSVAKGEKVQFSGPQDFAVLNRVVGHDESKIYGEIHAANHGNVYLINPNGILIGDGAVINTGSFIASTKDVTDVQSFINSGTVNFQGDAQGNIINLGAVQADRIEMHGDTISLKAADVDTNFNAPSITIDANTIHAGTPETEDGDVDQGMLNRVNTKLGVTADGFLLKDSMGALREAVEDNSFGHYMLSQDDLKNESWEGYAPNLNWGAAIDGLGYTVGNKNIVVGHGTDGTGIFGYISGDVRVDNFTFDHISVNDTQKNSNGTGTLAGYLDGDGVRVANVTVANGSVTGYNNVGGLIGWSDGFSNGNTFLNVHNDNTAVTGLIDNDQSGDAYTGVGIGGILGFENGWKNRDGKTNTFRNVSNSGHITGRSYVGGLVGRLITADMDQVRNTGRVEQQTVGTVVHTHWGDKMQYVDSQFIGGIAGALGPETEAAKGVRISHAYNGGTIGADTSKDGYFDKGNYIGGIVGMLSGFQGSDGKKTTDPYGAQDSVIDYAHNTGTITTGNKNIGGIVGYAAVSADGNVNDMILRHSWNEGTITGYDNVGGLAGEFGGSLEESYNNAPINGIRWGSNIGGLVGEKDHYLNSDLIIKDSYNTEQGRVEGTWYVGGILGHNESSGKLTMERIYNAGLVYNVIQNGGGIIGGLRDGSGEVKLDQLINFGDVYFPDVHEDGIWDGFEYGGLIGEADMDAGSPLSLTNSSNYGHITGRYSLGGLIGELYNEKNANVYLENNHNYGNIYSYETGDQFTGNRPIGGLIGQYDPRDGSLEIVGSANYGQITVEGNTDVGTGGLIGELSDGKVKLSDTHNYGNITSTAPAGGLVGIFVGGFFTSYSPLTLTELHSMLEIHNVSTPGNPFGEGLKEGQWTDRNNDYSKYNPAIADFANELKASGELKEGTTLTPDIPSRTTADFLSWKNTITLDPEGKLGTETGSYPDGGYVWKMYETGQKDSNGNMLYHKPELTAFQTKVVTQKSSVENKASDVSGALYDVTMPDGQQIKGVNWQRVLELQDQFTRVQYRGDGASQTAYMASDKETGGSVPDHLYGYYDSSQQGLNIFITPGTVKPEEPPTPDKPEPPTPDTPEPSTPDKPVLPNREVSRNDYLYSDEHDTGDGELHWYMHMPPMIYIKDAGIRTDEKLKDEGAHV